MPQESNPSPRPKPDPDNEQDDEKDLGYYYDDAHGYQTYDPSDDDEESMEDEKKTGQDLTRCKS